VSAGRPEDGKASASAVLAFERVSFGYEAAQPILEAFSWRVERGAFWSILGPSGSGKTTLLYLIAGIRAPKAGRVYLAGEPVIRPNPKVGLMLQDYGLLPWYTTKRNLELGLAIRGVARDERQRRSRYWLTRLGLTAVAGRYPGQLSGGQRQRVALARLLALEPEILLLDEPLSAVDELTRERLQRQLFALSREAGTTTLMVTHNIEEAVLLAERILLIGDHAPIRSFEVLATPFGGVMPERSDPRFIAFCRGIRERMGL
jgi:NitT/TauT family transport system ATP-binding protein